MLLLVEELALSEYIYKAQSWAKAVASFANLYYVWPFPKLLSSFLWLVEGEVSKQASWQVATEEVGTNTWLCLVFLSILLSCPSRYLHALQQNRTQSRLIYFFKKKKLKQCVEQCQRQSLDSSQVVHPAWLIPVFIALLSPGWDKSPLQGLPPCISSFFPNNLPVSIYTPGWRETLWG